MRNRKIGKLNQSDAAFVAGAVVGAAVVGFFVAWASADQTDRQVLLDALRRARENQKK